MPEETMSQWRGNDNASRILRLGFTAVPALLSLLDDPRPTRCLQWSRDELIGTPADSHPRLASHGQMALHLLADIAREPIRSREQALAWWNAVEDAGATETSQDSGAPDVVDYAKKRIDGEPAAGLREVIALARKAKGSLRVSLVKLLAEHKGTQQVEFLTAEAQSGPIPSARIHAAEGLRRRASTASR